MGSGLIRINLSVVREAVEIYRRRWLAVWSGGRHRGPSKGALSRATSTQPGYLEYARLTLLFLESPGNLSDAPLTDHPETAFKEKYGRRSSPSVARTN